MDKDEFVARSLKKLQQQIDDLTKTVDKLDKRIRSLEPSMPEEIVVRNANGKLEIYLIRDEEGNYIDPREDRT